MYKLCVCMYDTLDDLVLIRARVVHVGSPPFDGLALGRRETLKIAITRG